MIISLIMLTLIVLSVGTAFASDNSTDVMSVDDEITIDEPLAVSEDKTVSANESTAVVVTPETVNQYINESGMLYDNVTADEIVFNGNFDNLNLTVERSITLTGGNFTNPDFVIESSDVLLRNFTIVQDKGVSSIFVAGSEDAHISNVQIDNVEIEFSDDQGGAEAIPIEVMYSDDFMLMNSYIAYCGRTNGNYLSNAVRLTSSKNAIIFNNKIYANLTSVPVGWDEVPAGSGNWVSSPMSGAIVIKNSDGAILDENLINVTCGNASGEYDTIYTVEVTESNDVLITNNEIVSEGNSYIYGIVISGDDFTIRGNNITSTGVLYSNGIDIEGPATGVVENNNVDVNAVTSAYAIYSGMNGQNVSANYTGNNISGKAYNIFGFSLGDVESNVNDNYVDLEGNYTTGLAARTGVLNAAGNRIILTSSEQGNESVWEGFGVEARGILVIAGTANITNNTIATPGKGVVLTGNETVATLEGNFINVVGNDDKDAYALYADEIASLIVNNNTVDYQGTTQGTGINNAVYIYNTTDASITDNTFTLDLVSSYVPWIEVPAGSGNWVSFPVSEGIVVDSSENVLFARNNVTLTYGDVVGSYDTIYAVDFKNSDYALIESNKINAKGHTYIYGIILSGDTFNINYNTITVESDNYYANGIDIEGPASGFVYNNTIDVTGVQSAYAIYSGMNGQNVSGNYLENTITAKAYNVFGMSLGDVESNIENNLITLDGNYTTGIAYRGSNLNVTGNHIVLTSSEEGNETVWENFGVEAVGIKVINGTAIIENNTISTPGKGVHVEGSETDVYLYENFINVVGNVDQNAYAIFAIDASSLYVNLNTIDYQGATNGTGVNNAVYANNVTLTTIIANNFTLDLVSCYVPWFEVPAGSGNWVSFPISEGIVIEDTDNPVFSLNNVNVTYGDAVGAYDTIYAVDIKADNAIISENEINAKGHTHIYGLIITGENFTVEANNITTESDNYYANGIDIEGPATGVVKDNGIIAKGVQLAYPVYSGMNGQDVSVNYTGNDLVGDAYLVIGMSLGDVESNIADGSVTVTGNYTTGIAYRGSKLTVDNTQISSKGSNIGNESVWEAFGTDTAGIKVVQGTSTITNNAIETTADYAVDVKGTVASVHDNMLLGKLYYGDSSVANATLSTVYDNGPWMVIVPPVDYTIGGSGNVTIAIPFANGTATVIYDGITATPVQFNNGIAVYTIDNITGGHHSIVVIYQGNEAFNGLYNYTAFDAEEFASDFANMTITGDLNITANLVNALGDPIANATIKYSVGDVNGTIVTDENGLFTIAGKEGEVVTIEYDGSDFILPTSISITLKDIAPVRAATMFNVTAGTSIPTYAVDYGAGERGNTVAFKLTDADGNPIANATVNFAYKTTYFNRTTDENGIVSIGISTQIAGEYLCALSYLGDDTHNATFVPFSFNIQKKVITISASAKTFKSTAKTKKYTVTLKTKAFNSKDGKVYLKAGKKVTLKINGKTYTAKTNAKGQATFSLKITKKGKFTSKISFAGDKTYEAASKSVKITIK